MTNADLIDAIMADGDLTFRLGQRGGAREVAEMIARGRGVAMVRAEALEAQWQPIETAPKDGRLIILTTGTTSGTGRWSIIASRDTLNDIDGVAVFSREYGWRSASDKAITGSKPTHWMPLPAPPTAIRALSATPQESGE